jgi:ribose 1,5-bisphosphate isomerase
MIPKEVLEIADGIKTMRIRGASLIAKSAAQALRIAAERYSGDAIGFKPYITKVANLLLQTRPTAVSLPNAVYYVLNRTLSSSVSEARETAIRSSDEFIRMVDESHRRIMEYGSKLIQDEYVVFTHCHSTAVVDIILQAFREGKRVEVINTETRPLFQGRITLRELAKNGVKVTHIPDSAVRHFIKNANIVIVGADTITSDGYLVNKVGTSHLALAAWEAGIPFYSAAEFIKFSPASLEGGEVVIEFRSASEVLDIYPGGLADELRRLGVEVLNPAFDFTPPEFITAFITNLGIIPPQLSVLIIKEMFGFSTGRIQLAVLEELV